MLLRMRFVFLISLFLLSFAAVSGPIDSTIQLHFQKLVKKMRLRGPVLKEGEHDIRIWKKCELCYGDAHELYHVEQKTDKLSVTKYIIKSNKRGYRRSTKLEPSVSPTMAFWKQLMEHDLLTLPDQSLIDKELHPKQQRDSTWTSVEQDGSISVHAKKAKRSVWISDGESYYFEVYGADTYRSAEYGNPKGYDKVMPGISELQDVVFILNSLESLFK